MNRSAPPISHLLFAGDIMIFSQANRQWWATFWLSTRVGQDRRLIMENLHYSAADNTHQELAAALCDFLQVKAMSIHSKYLGLPLFMGCSRKKAFEDVKAKVMSKVAGWKVRTLSQAERATLIKSVAIAMPIYCMSTFLLPNGWCAEIDRTLMDFWWGFPTQKARNCTPRAWDDICLPKELGGLGVRKMFEVNKALIAKLGWKLIFETDSLSVRTIRLKYKVRDPMVASVVGGGGIVPGFGRVFKKYYHRF